MSDTASESTTPPESDQQPARPFLRVLKGNPDDVQVAALTTLFAVMASNSAAAPVERERNLWGSVSERLRRPVTYNPTAFHNVSFF